MKRIIRTTSAIDRRLLSEREAKRQCSKRNEADSITNLLEKRICTTRKGNIGVGTLQTVTSSFRKQLHPPRSITCLEYDRHIVRCICDKSPILKNYMTQVILNFPLTVKVCDRLRLALNFLHKFTSNRLLSYLRRKHNRAHLLITKWLSVYV